MSTSTELNKYLQKFARKRDGTYYNKKITHGYQSCCKPLLESPPYSKPFSI